MLHFAARLLKSISIPRLNSAKATESPLGGGFMFIYYGCQPLDTDRPFRRMLFAAFLMAFALRTRFAYLNKRNQRTLANMPKEEKAALDTGPQSEIWDNDPRYVFMT